MPAARVLTLRAEPVSAVSSVPVSPAIAGLGVGKRNDWATPPEVMEALDCNFALDVAAPVDGPLHVPCDFYFSDSALERHWFGFVWMNPPFGGRNGIRPWLDKFLDHGDGVALTPDRVSAPWFQDLWPRADAILFTPKTPFLLPDGSKGGNPAFGNALWAVGELGVRAVRRAAAAGFGRLCIPAQAIDARSDGTAKQGPARRAKARSGKPMRPTSPSQEQM